MAVKIGISPIAWQNDDLPDLTADYTMEQALSEARQIGYTGVERGQRMPADTEGLRAYLEKYQIKLCGGWCSGNLLINDLSMEINQIKNQIKQFIALDAPCIVYAECSNTIQGDQTIPVNNRPTLTLDEIKAYGQKLSELAEWSIDQGMPMAYHHHMGSIIEAEADVDALMTHTRNALSLCFDTGHLLFGGGNVMETLKRWNHRIAHVHYKDIRPDIVRDIRQHYRSFLDAVIAGAFTVPGDGCIDFAEVTRYLQSIDYSGWIVVEAEQDPKKAPPYEYSEKGYKHIVACCQQAELEIVQ